MNVLPAEVWPLSPMATTARAMSAQRNKTDATDALGLAHLMRIGWFRQAHIKTDDAYRLKLLLNSSPQFEAQVPRPGEARSMWIGCTLRTRRTPRRRRRIASFWAPTHDAGRSLQPQIGARLERLRRSAPADEDWCRPRTTGSTISCLWPERSWTTLECL